MSCWSRSLVSCPSCGRGPAPLPDAWSPPTVAEGRGHKGWLSRRHSGGQVVFFGGPVRTTLGGLHCFAASSALFLQHHLLSSQSKTHCTAQAVTASVSHLRERKSQKSASLPFETHQLFAMRNGTEITSH